MQFVTFCDDTDFISDSISSKFNALFWAKYSSLISFIDNSDEQNENTFGTELLISLFLYSVICYWY